MAVKNVAYQLLIEDDLDAGEASIIALYAETEAVLLILDDHKARKYAEALHLNYTGTLSVMLKAKEKGIIPSVKSIIDKIQQTNFRFSEKLLNTILSEAGEL